MKSIVEELKRRKVFRVAGAYAVVAWLLIEVIVSIEEPLSLPGWTDTLVIVLLAAGFVVAIVLAYAYDLTPDGIVRSGDDAGDAAGASRPSFNYAVIAALAAAAGAAFFWLLSRDSDTQWLVIYALPEIEAALDVADWDAAYSVVREIEQRMPGSEELEDLWTRVSWKVTISSEPLGAAVHRQEYDATDNEWEVLGQTPLQDIRFPYGLSKLRFDLDGYLPLYRTLGGGHINWTELGRGGSDGLLIRVDDYTLDTESSLPEGMVRVNGWTQVIDGNPVVFGDYFLGKYEVTNAEFRVFVDAGGYRQRNLWDPVLIDGKEVPWEEAMQRFADRTGQQGPATWEAGDYPAGGAGLPVSGISWYEAKAYARFAGAELPTTYHWQRAIGNAEFPWLLPASNFSGSESRNVADSRAMSFSGVFDMAGNVREWTENPINDERVILGGSWNDPYYIAAARDTSAPPLDRSAGNGLRLALTSDETPVRSRAAAAIRARDIGAPGSSVSPVSDEVYRAYSRAFDYDFTPLNATPESTDATRIWTRERISFDAAYGSERMLLHLYLPTQAAPPYQTVIYWPGWDTFRLDDIDEYFAKQVDFIVKSGRAVAFPIYKGIFERRVGNERSRPAFNTAAYRDNTISTVRDLRRTIDYLESRRDIDSDALAFFGYSWGGVNGPTALAQEPRLKLGVINIGMLPPMSDIPEVDPVNALPRVTVPILMFSGEFDGLVPLENARRYFELIGTPDADKDHVLAIGGHFIPRELLIRETLAWFDRYFGPAPQ